MLDAKYFFWRNPKFKKATNVRNVPIYVFLLIVMAIAWSGVKTIQDNYKLQKHISVLKQQNEVLSLQNDNTKLQNVYYQTNQYLDLAARQDLGLVGPGEKVMLISKTTALKYVDQSLAVTQKPTPLKKPSSKYLSNLEAWRDFLLGRKILAD